MDLKLNDDWDVDFADGDLETIEKRPEVGQRLAVRHKANRGEWRYNNEFGLPYTDEILVKNYNVGRIGVFFRQQILTTPGVVRVEDFDIGVDSSNTLQVEYTAITRFGRVYASVQQQASGFFGTINMGYGPGIM